jgi:hypothetical protein
MDLGEIGPVKFDNPEPQERRSPTALAVWLSLPLLPLVVVVTAIINLSRGDGAFTHGMATCLPWGMGTAAAYFLLVYVPVGIYIHIADRRDARR